ncbi:MAG: uroporphyrinogen-III C-methyltransferase, partial [Deltaproteobacteria bacterium]|nr:uroporphyrinogen-III C-methyltransferase [Deltaproteobacteria bacterium]
MKSSRSKSSSAGSGRGTVYLVGAGPGDPGLLTRRGADLLARAEVVIYDYLANPELLDLASPQAELIYVGKMGRDHTFSQEQINQLLIDQARTRQIVVRLKGGDPFIFGRGGEEAEVLVEAGINYEVVPGVSSAVAGPAYAGIPLTHRAFNSAVTLATGHEDPTKEASRLDWEALAKSQTLVFLMGMKRLEANSQALIDHGLDPDTPAALVQNGTTPDQRCLVSTISQIAAQARAENFQPPAVLVVGQVVRLREKLDWLEKRPLWGLRVLITRTAQGAGHLAAMVRELGAEAIIFPTVALVEPENKAPLQRAAAHLDQYDWLIFTSANGVEFFFKELAELGLDSRALGRLRVCAIGPATAKALAARNIKADRVPTEYRAEAVVEILADQARQGKRFLLVRAQEARQVLPRELTALGGQVETVAAYQNVLPPQADRQALEQRLAAGEVDVVLFTASSTVNNLARLFPDKPLARLLARTEVAVIGPVTART